MRTDLRDARLAKGLTQDALAELIGKDQGVVSRYENGKARIDADVAPAIANALGIGVLEVLYAPKLEKQRRKAAA